MIGETAHSLILSIILNIEKKTSYVLGILIVHVHLMGLLSADVRPKAPL